MPWLVRSNDMVISSGQVRSEDMAISGFLSESEELPRPVSCSEILMKAVRAMRMTTTKNRREEDTHHSAHVHCIRMHRLNLLFAPELLVAFLIFEVAERLL